MLAASTGAWSQTAPPAATTLSTVVVQEQAEPTQGKDTLRATTTNIGKGQQQLRDIPQSITVITEKLMDDRNLDTVKDALRNTAGITFQAAEGGEEDIRLRGFSLAGTACAIPPSTTATPSTRTASKSCAARPPCCSDGAPRAAR
jgi:catecholate siderophore receptor